MALKLLKKVILFVLAFAIVLSLSCCGGDEVSIDEIGSETTETTTETTAETLSEEELDELVQNMPEIVFVLSYQVYHENIFGYYVKNTGEVKMFDFREIAPDEIYDIHDVYDRLEEVTYDGLYFRKHGEILGKKKISEDDLNTLSEEKLIEYYKRLLLIEGDAEYVVKKIGRDAGWGYYNLYGIKNNNNGEKECIILWGDEDNSEYKHSNPDAKEIYRELVLYNFFPDLPHHEWYWAQ